MSHTSHLILYDLEMKTRKKIVIFQVNFFQVFSLCVKTFWLNQITAFITKPPEVLQLWNKNNQVSL